MLNYAFLNILRGQCNSMGLSEIKFRYPLRSDREISLHKQTIEKITQFPFQLGFFWSLVDASEYKVFVGACARISNKHPEPIYVPEDIMHGIIAFDLNFRFDGYKVADKEQLVQRLVDIGIKPCNDALDLSYRYGAREREVLMGRVDHERLAREERMAFARSLSFHSEE